MTLAELQATPWNCMRDYPNIGYPWRAPRLAYREYRNKHGVQHRASVLTNRTKTRFWVEIVAGGEMENDQLRGGTLRLYRTTASRKIADNWIAAIQGGVA